MPDPVSTNGGQPEIADRLETVAHRVEFVELLDEEDPLPPRDVVDALDYSRGTVTRDPREAGFVEKTEEGYAPTLVGVMAAEEYRRYERASRAIIAAEHLLAPIPRTHDPPVEVLVDAERILAETGIPVRALETVADRVYRADVDAARETFETVDAPQDALATLAELVETCRTEGDEEPARTWGRRARDLLAEAPEPTAAQHREWVECHAAEVGYG